MGRWITLLWGTVVVALLWTGSTLAEVQKAGNTARAAEPSADDPFADLSRPGKAKQTSSSEKQAATPPSPEAAKKSPKPANEPKTVRGTKGATAKPGGKRASGRHSTTLDAGPLRAGEKAILKALDEPASLDLAEKPLSALAEEILRKHRIPVVLDRKALEECGLSSETPVTAVVEHIPLCDALDLILYDAGLAWTVRWGVLLITTTDAADSILIAKCYDVTDLATTMPDRPYKGNSLPGAGGLDLNQSLGVLPSMPVPGSMSSPGGFRDGPLGTGSSSMERATGLDLDSVMEMITSTVEPITWGEVGGQGNIEVLGNSLVINQTLQVHRKIEAMLSEVRAKRENGSTLVVELQWLWLDAAQERQLLGSLKPSPAARGPAVLDAKSQTELAAKVPGFRGQITCSNGQLVHLASGDRHSVITSAIPVVGSGIGYQPVVDRLNVGLIVELRASAVPGSDAAILDVQSTVTRWGKQPPPVNVGASWPPYQETTGSSKEGNVAQETVEQPGGSASVAVDRPVVPVQQLATTVRVPLGKPVVIGAMTFSPSGRAGLDRAGEQPMQMYLIATTRIAALAQQSRN